MARAKTYTQDQLQTAQAALKELPDLRANKIPAPEALEQLRDQIVILASKKGYSKGEIKKALADVGIDVSEKAISDTIGVKPKRAPKRP
ncbi:mobilization protein [Pseudomonas syringae pv. aptata]|uniref:mobilization protein n=1 Tax=Pseudomonas syringae TaxID=317 RepID=UPI003F8BED9E